jgi:GDP-L-fucose synthase
MKYNNILLTGGYGFLGSAVYEKLLSKGYTKENIFRFRSSEFNLLKENDVSKLFSLHNPDLVIHAAGDVGGIGYSKKNPGTQLFNNSLMNLLTFHYSKLSKVKKFIGIGSVCSYPKFAKTPFIEDYLWQGYPEETNAAYGISKLLMLEQSKAYFHQYNFVSTNLILINLYGPRDNFSTENSHVIPALIKKIDFAIENRQDTITIWGDGSPTREFIYVDDAAEGIVESIDKYDSYLPINIGSGTEISIFELTNLLAKIMKWNGRIIFDKSKPNGQPKRNLDVSKASRIFNFKAKTSLYEGLQKTIKYYLDSKK